LLEDILKSTVYSLLSVMLDGKFQFLSTLLTCHISQKWLLNMKDITENTGRNTEPHVWKILGLILGPEADYPN
jgi:hypothetical protein